MVGACQSPASLQFDEAGAGRCERLGRKSTRSECPETRPATPASTARLVMIERIDGAPRRPVTVAPSLSTWRNNGPAGGDASGAEPRCQALHGRRAEVAHVPAPFLVGFELRTVTVPLPSTWCGVGSGTRGGTSRGEGSGSRYLKVVCQHPGCEQPGHCGVPSASHLRVTLTW